MCDLISVPPRWISCLHLFNADQPYITQRLNHFHTYLWGVLQRKEYINHCLINHYCTVVPTARQCDCDGAYWDDQKPMWYCGAGELPSLKQGHEEAYIEHERSHHSRWDVIPESLSPCVSGERRTGREHESDG